MRSAGPQIVRFAEAEELTAHARAIQVRLDRLAQFDGIRGVDE
jgi:histidinol dehydrogenase